MQKSNVKMSEPKQRQQVGFYRKLLALDYDVYQDMMSISYGKTSSKDLTYVQAQDFVKHLKTLAQDCGVFKPTLTQAYTLRHGMATPKQINKIKIMWHNVTKQDTPRREKIALRLFLKRIVGANDLNFLRIKDVPKIIKALEKMEDNKNV